MQRRYLRLLKMLAVEMNRHEKMVSKRMIPMEIADQDNMIESISNDGNIVDNEMLLALLLHALSENELIDMEDFYSIIYGDGKRIVWH